MKRRTFITTSATGALIAMPLGQALSKAIPAETVSRDITDGLKKKAKIDKFTFIYNSVSTPSDDSDKDRYFDMVKYHNARVNHFRHLTKEIPEQGFALIKAQLVSHPDYFKDLSQCLLRIDIDLFNKEDLSFIKPEFTATPYHSYHKNQILRNDNLAIDEDLHKDYLINYDDVLV